jgi:hypothetical protein
MAHFCTKEGGTVVGEASSLLEPLDLKHAKVGTHYRAQGITTSSWPQTSAGEKPHHSFISLAVKSW